MQYDTLTNKSYNQTAEVWVRFQQDEDSGDIVHNFSRVIRCNIIYGQSMSLYCNDPDIPMSSHIRNIRDFNNVSIGDSIYTVVRKMPVVNVMGFAEGYAYSLAPGTAAKR